MHDWNRQSHVKWDCKYHIVFIPKYRQKVIYGKLRSRVGTILRELCSQKGVELLEGKAMSDHNKHYYQRVRTFLQEYRLPKIKPPLDRQRVLAFFRSIVRLGILGKERFHYWRLLLWTLFRRPRLFSEAVTFAIYGYHFRKVCEIRLVECSAESARPHLPRRSADVDWE